jgi:hypothetical protein
MKGISVLIYTILLLVLYFLQSSAFLTMAGIVKGVPTQINYVANRIHDQLSTADEVEIPNEMATFVADCILPNHPQLDDEDTEAAEQACVYPQNATQTWPGVVCVIYDYYEQRFRVCRALVYEPTSTYYFDGSQATVLPVERDLEEGTLTIGTV